MTGACVYWVRLPEHIDYEKEGYVGVAVDFDLRMKDHYRETSRYDTHFARAIRLYGWRNLLKEVIFVGTDEQCFAFEQKLRPTHQLGWNEAPGGTGGDRSQFIDYAARKKPLGNRNSKHGTDNPFYGKTHSEQAKLVNSRAHAQKLITTPYGVFFGFSALARHLKVHKATAKKIAIKERWEIADKPELFNAN